jgi:hypothetical protein
MSLFTFFLFIATPKSLGIIIDIVLDPLGLPLYPKASLTSRKSA